MDISALRRLPTALAAVGVAASNPWAIVAIVGVCIIGIAACTGIIFLCVVRRADLDYTGRRRRLIITPRRELSRPPTTERG